MNSVRKVETILKNSEGNFKNLNYLWITQVVERCQEENAILSLGKYWLQEVILEEFNNGLEFKKVVLLSINHEVFKNVVKND